MAVFKVKDQEFEILEARGRNGRRAVNWLITKVGSISSGDSADVGQLFTLLDDDEFLSNHLKAFVGEDAAKFIDQNSTADEMLNGVVKVIEDVFAGFQTPEVDAALKNSADAQEE